MEKSKVALVKYEKPQESVQNAVEVIQGLDDVPTSAKVFIKPNIVYWNRHVTIPKWGVITTSRVIEDVVCLLKEKGIDNITIGEGIVTEDLNDTETALDAWEKLGYNKLKERYGVEVYNLFDRPYEKIDIGCGFDVNFSADALHADFLINLPVLKTHVQAIVSLGIKNLKGLLNIPSRKKFHTEQFEFNLSKLPEQIPPCLTVIDGIYSLERGPAMDGKARKSNILVASRDILAADLVGSKLLGWDPSNVPYLVHAAENKNRPLDFSDIEVVGEDVDSLASFHEFDYVYEENDTLPLPFANAGITGITYRKYDKTMCTYCSAMNGMILNAIKMAWDGKPFDNIEVLTGKLMEPTPGMNKTILVGQCMWKKNKGNPDIKELIPIKGCPPSREAMKEALEQAGIEAPDFFYNNLDQGPALFMKKYRGNPEFEENFFQIN